jgi:uncharacterized membrane protein
MFTNRNFLFYLQSLIAITTMMIIGFILVPDLTEQLSEHVLKVTIAPFPALSLLIFLLFVFNKIVKDLDDKVYSFSEMLFGFATVLIISVLIFIGTSFALSILQSIDKKIFLFSLLLGLIIFFILRISNLYTMAIMTGLSEGIILYIIFIY